MDEEVDELWRCDCHGSHFLHVYNLFPEEGYPLTFCFEMYERPNGLLARLKHAWKVLRWGETPWMEFAIGYQMAYELRGVLLPLAEVYEAEKAAAASVAAGE